MMWLSGVKIYREHTDRGKTKPQEMMAISHRDPTGTQFFVIGCSNPYNVGISQSLE